MIRFKKGKVGFLKLKFAFIIRCEIDFTIQYNRSNYWIISTLVRRSLFFNRSLCKSWDCPNGAGLTSAPAQQISFSSTYLVIQLVNFLIRFKVIH